MELTKEDLKDHLGAINKRFDGIEQRLAHLPTKEDVAGLKEDVAGLQSNVSTLQSTVAEIKETIERIDKRDMEDSDAFAKSIVKLEKDIKQLKLKHAS